MRRLVNTIALGAAMIALALGVWRDYSAYTALRQTAIVYLITYFLAGGLSLATRAAVAAVRDPDPEPPPAPEKGRRRRKKRPDLGRPAGPTSAGENAAAAANDETAAAEPVPAG